MKQTHKLLAVLLSLIMILSILPLSAFAGGGNYHGDDLTEGLFYYQVSDDTATVTGITDETYEGELVIPNTLGGYPVTTIANFSFSYLDGITSINMPDTVTSIGYAAFEDCEGLKSVTIPNSVTSIDHAAFSGCTGITSLVLGNSVDEIGEWAFSGCTGLTSITIPESVTYIAWAVFEGCSNLKELKVDKNNKTYHSDGNCIIETKSKTVISVCNTGVIPTDGSVTDIGDYAFSGFDFTDVAIPEGITSIGYCAFFRCSRLRTITLPSSVKSISAIAFSCCPALESIKVDKNNSTYHSSGNSLIETERKALIAGCKNSVIPNDGSVTKIGNYAFYGCSDLKKISLPQGVTSIGCSAFQDCGITTIVIPNSLSKVDDQAFDYCDNLTDVYYTGTEQDKENIAFSDWISGNWDILKATWHYNYVPVPDEEIFKYEIVNGEATVTGLVDENTAGAIVIPSTIGGYPVKYIRYFAFENCKQLTNVIIPEGLFSIGSDAFYGCTGLKSIYIPASVRSCGSSPFSSCVNLESITVDKDNDNYHSDGNCLIYTKHKTLTSGCKNSIIPDDGSVTSIGYRAFAGQENLKEIDIPESITFIDDGAFSACVELSVIEIPKNVTFIGGSAFAKCVNLGSIYLPNSITDIGWYAFGECKELTDVYYYGTEEQKEKITIDEGNEDLLNATWHYNYAPSHKPGDISGDGNLNNGDLVLLFQYLSGWDVTVNEAAVDVNGDGKENNQDLVLLFQYLSGWNVEIF